MKENQSKFLTLSGCWLVIVVGNSLVIGMHHLHRRRHIPDYLILVLAVIDLVNALGPASFSLIMYKVNVHGFLQLKNKTPCYSYCTAATMLRLSACFIMTMMAIDRAISVDRPLYYRTSLQLRTVKRWTTAAIFIAIIVAFVPVTGVANVIPYQAMCTFDFQGGYAMFLATLGYIQLLVVLVCYIAVVRGIILFTGKQPKTFNS